MKISIILLSFLMMINGITYTLALDTQPVTEMHLAEVKDDLSHASKIAHIKYSADLLSAFLYSAENQPLEFNLVYKSVPKDVRVARLARFFEAKVSAARQPSQSLAFSRKNLSDFHWGYVRKDTVYSILEFTSSNPAKLVAIDMTDAQYKFSRQTFELVSGEKFLVPKASTEGVSRSTLEFQIGNKKALWTGYPNSGQLAVIASGTSKGCEIFVNSKPDKATVYFNGKKWYALTNTSAVRGPGKVEVTVQLSGYANWNEMRMLEPGDSWTINAPLEKQ